MAIGEARIEVTSILHRKQGVQPTVIARTVVMVPTALPDPKKLSEVEKLFTKMMIRTNSLMKKVI